jgi:hypothetical protein
VVPWVVAKPITVGGFQADYYDLSSPNVHPMGRTVAGGETNRNKTKKGARSFFCYAVWVCTYAMRMRLFLLQMNPCDPPLYSVSWHWYVPIFLGLPPMTPWSRHYVAQQAVT